MCCHLTKARSLTFYKAFAVETQRGYSEKWTQGPTDFNCLFYILRKVYVYILSEWALPNESVRTILLASLTL